jgi:cell shape-determining protein MreC
VKHLIGLLRGKKDVLVTIDVFVDHATYDKFRAYTAENGLDESTALMQVLERGMNNYWLQEFKQLKQNYLPMKKLFEEYKRDNEALKALEKQNEQLQKILKEKGRQRKTPINQ